MNVYKVRVSDQKGKPIDRTDFEEDTKRLAPWYVDGRDTQFAVCPACDNPIEIVGLYHLPPNINNPYGRHFARDVGGLAKANEEAREDCPYFNPRQHDKGARKRSVDGVPKKILELLIDQFDRVIFAIEECTGLKLSENFIISMLERYRGERGYLYTGATLMNVPWIFAYMSDGRSLYGQLVAGNPELVKSLSALVPGADTDSGRLLKKVLPSGKSAYITPTVCFLDHRVRPKEDSGVLETMIMVVTEGGKDIYRQVIEFNYQHFSWLIGLPADHPKRRLELVTLAKQKLGNLL